MNLSERDALIEIWLREKVGLAPLDGIRVASADASFRRYLRIRTAGRSYIIMDAPPEHEPTDTFVDVATRLAAGGIHVPAIHARDGELGLMLLEDFGDRHYLRAVTECPAELPALYERALRALLEIQYCDSSGLPDYDAALLKREMALFETWYLNRHLGMTLNDEQKALLGQAIEQISSVVLEQPVAFVHRDYHSRNLMALDTGGPGVLDFQDAVRGGICYDLISLLRDSYLSLPEARVRDWADTFRIEWNAHANAAHIDAATFRRWFDFTAAQRHLKVLGIFARLAHRDGKHGYLRDLPLTHCHLQRALANWPEMKPLQDFISTVSPPESVNPP